MNKRKGLASLGVVALIAVMIIDTLVLLSIPPNPSDSILRAKFIEVAKKYNIPSVILMGIAYTESGWKQFDASGNPIIHTNTDGSIDIGIMQINSKGRSDIDRLKTDVFYNIEVGAKILDGKWKITPAIGDSDRNILENWYYAIWAYNGFSYINHPANPNGRYYQDKVIDNIARLIIGDDGQPLWTPVSITKPDPSKITNPPTYIDTPTPYHFGDLYENPNDNARVVQANTDLIMPTNSDVHLQFIIQNVGTSTWSPTIFNNPYSVKLTLVGGNTKIEKSIPISNRVQPGETYLCDFVVSVGTPNNYEITVEFFNGKNPFGQKVKSSITFANFSVLDQNNSNQTVSNYTINLNYKTDLNVNFIPYLFVKYVSNTQTLSTDLVQGINTNGQISFSILPNFKVPSSVTLETYLAFSTSSSLTNTFSYFYKGSYTISFNPTDGIILDSYPAALITVDGNSTNLTTRAFVPLTLGNHTISLTKDGYNTYTLNYNYSSFDYVFVNLAQSTNNKPQASLTNVDFQMLNQNESKFVNVLISAPDTNTIMFLMSTSKMFSFYPASIKGKGVITVIADARWGNVGTNTGSITFSYNGVKNAINLTASVQVIGASLKANPASLTVRVPDLISFDVILNTDTPLKNISFKVDYPQNNLEFVSFNSSYLVKSNDSLTFTGDVSNVQSGSSILTLTFKAISESADKVLINFANLTATNETKVNVYATPFELKILPPFVKPSKVTGITLINNVSKVEFSFSESIAGSYRIKDYEIYRSKTNDLLTAMYVGETTNTRFTDLGPFEQNNTYYYWVIAVDEKGNSSDPSDTFVVKPIVFSDTKVNAVKLEFYIGSPYYYINGIQMKMDTSPIILGGRTFVPVRFIAEPLYAQVIWRGETKTVIVALKDKIIELYIGNPLASINGVQTAIDKDNPQVAPFIKDGRTMLPLRFIAENFGAEVLWDSVNKKVTILYNSATH
ncbi:MAG: stalk domain-containing protein [Caldisericum sp.]